MASVRPARRTETAPTSVPSVPPPRAKWSFPKLCACGRKFHATAWKALPYVGIMSDRVETLELRNCPCGSTIAVPTPAL